MKNGNVSIEKAGEDLKQFIWDLNQTTTENRKYRKKYQSDTIINIKYLCNSRQNVIDLFNDYAKIRSKFMLKTKQGTGQY